MSTHKCLEQSPLTIHFSKVVSMQLHEVNSMCIHSDISVMYITC